MKLTKKDLLSTPVRHVDITAHNVVPLVDAMKHMAYSARDLNRAAEIYVRMLQDGDGECGVILCLAGSLVSAGLKQVFVDMVFFEALGFKHWVAPEEYKSGTLDGELRELMIDRIYDTFIDEEELRACDETVQKIADSLEPRPYSSREFIREMGAWLEEKRKVNLLHSAVDSIVYQAYKHDVPIFCPAFSDC